MRSQPRFFPAPTRTTVPNGLTSIGASVPKGALAARAVRFQGSGEPGRARTRRLAAGASIPEGWRLRGCLGS
jgi:hypothetical protein